MEPFNLTDAPLVGTNLIEASAGTGKTFTIAELFLRLIIEKRLAAEQILVVTFTNAATDELKDRIRKKLVATKAALIRDLQAKPTPAIQLIQDALNNFDRVPIFTIHSFCQRILSEHAFETGSLFDTELITDQTNLLQEVADDFWRKYFYLAPPEFINYSISRISGPSYFLNLLTKIMTPDITVIPETAKPSLASLEPFKKTLQTLQNTWRHSRDDVAHLLNDPSLSGTVYGSLKADPKHPSFTKRDVKIFALRHAMDKYVDLKSIGFPLFPDFKKFTATYLKTSAKKNLAPPSHPVFDICEELYDQGCSLENEMGAYLLFLKNEFVRFASKELLKRKKNKNIQFFDDLLITVKQALQNRGGNLLATAIQQKYKAALVDEFQDTDSVQYEIFNRLFPAKDGVLYMIGDPKQAIYGFRGADIFSYIKASREADRKFTLAGNWRSEPGLITAINTIFSNVTRPFVFDEIPFENGSPGQRPSCEKKKLQPPLKLWYLIPEKVSKKNKLLNKTEAVQLISRTVASEIARMISPSLDAAPTRVAAGNIAVLVRTNRQARIIRDHLSEKRIPCVLYSSESIFDSPEAMEMETILLSITEPSNERRLRAALVTDIMGVPGDDLNFLENEPAWWEPRLTRFKEYFEVWQRHGFIRMFRVFLTKEKIKERLLSFPDGERRLTNILHLSEILHQVSSEKKQGMAGLLKWLYEQRDPATPRLEAHQLRLESDALAVKIVTIHKSKGLEYEIVFCPFGWEGSLIKDKEVVFHDLNAQNRLTLDLSPNEDGNSIACAQNELLSENLRLLYVALTRAQKACYLVWGLINTAATSAMAYLFHGRRLPADLGDKGNPPANLKKIFQEMDSDKFLFDLEQLAGKSKGTITVVPLPLDRKGEYNFQMDKEEKLYSRKFSGKIDTTWKVSSYSLLVSGLAAKDRSTPDVEFPDHDTFRDIYWLRPDNLGNYADSPDIYGKTDIFSFPRGTRAGIFFHDIFEHLDFRSTDPQYQEKLVTKKLEEYRFDSKWNETVCKMLKNVLGVPLPGSGKDILLSSVADQSRINEAEFYFPLKPVTPQTLKRIFTDYGGISISQDFPERLEKLSISTSAGYMKGYVDMIFHHNGRFFLVDWKSNYLGSCIEDYRQGSLDASMQADFYILQYHLYVLAIHQYLRLRVPGYRYESHFGGVFYVFIRGVDLHKGPAYGIYSDLPNWDLIKALGKSLIPDFETDEFVKVRPQSHEGTKMLR
ncbi:MAG: exodeoxyribonuclease V subunit beta [Deltaproteobacteria bacterium]|nr:exodeoxyribonuclease V subunit beta [Deltaproteobacteria bacterium]